MVGGQTAAGPQATVLSTAADGSGHGWAEENPAPVPLRVATLAGCTLADKIYVLGGAPARFLCYDPATKCWDDGLPQHPLRSQAAHMATHDGAVWVMGGGVIIDEQANPAARGDTRQYSTAVHSYTPGAAGWQAHPDMPTEQCWGAAWSYDGRLLAIGGAHRDRSAGTYLFDNRIFAKI